ncbi:MAG: hypothetical protein ACRDQ5_08135, partial [Sciscionella sp.]
SNMTTAQSYRYIEPVRGLGTTWYTRGLAYWLRRLGFSVLFFVLAAGGGVLSVFLLRTFWVDRTTPIAVKIGATVVGAVATGWSAVATIRSMKRGKTTGPRAKSRSGLLAVSVGLVGLARMTALGVVVLGLSFFITFGSMSVVFVSTLGREFGDEHQARLRDRKRNEVHGNPPKQRQRKRGRR